MCGRIAQFSAWQSYVEALEVFRIHDATYDDPRPRFNAGPGTRIGVIWPDGTMKREWWGIRPHGAVARKIPQLINARGDKITSSAWKPMLKSGRVIVPADCWYEWIVDEDKKKQPYLLRAKNGATLFLAGLTNVRLGAESGPRDAEQGAGMIDGTVIVTDASDQGMVDIHDRRPVALTAADARHWLDPDTTAEHAAEIARTASRPVSEFEWFRVSRELNDARHDAPQLIKPVDSQHQPTGDTPSLLLDED